MTVYAKNKDAVAICNRSGQKMMRADMVEDGYLRGLLVHPDWYDPYHPQEEPFDPDEGIAIYRPAPDLMPIPPGPSLLLHTPVSVGGQVQVQVSITQPNPPGSTVTRWELWRSPVQAIPAWTRVALQLPTAPNFIPASDLLGTEALNQVPTGVVNSTNIGNQFGTITDTTAVNGTSYMYYVVTDTADTSNTQSPNQFPNGLQSAPTFVNQLGQTVSGTPTGTGGPPATTPKTVVALAAVFIAMAGATSMSKYLYSADGVTWNLGTMPLASSFQGIAFGGSSPLWVVLTGGQNVLTSTDGLTWVQHTTALAAATAWNRVAWSAKLGLFVAVAGTASTSNIATSPDGINWTTRTGPSATALGAVIWSARLGLFIASVGGVSTVAPITSPDGINWTSHTALGSSGNQAFLYDFGAAYDIIAMGTGSSVYAVSPDGINWTQKTSSGAAPFNGNANGAVYQVSGTVYMAQGTVPTNSIIKTSAIDLNSGWSAVLGPPNPPGQNGTGTPCAATSAALGLSVIITNAAAWQTMSTSDGTHYTVVTQAAQAGALTIIAAAA